MSPENQYHIDYLLSIRNESNAEAVDKYVRVLNGTSNETITIGYTVVGTVTALA